MIWFACRPSPGILSLVPIVGPSMRPSGRYRKVITDIGTSRRCYIAVVETIAQTKKLIRSRSRSCLTAAATSGGVGSCLGERHHGRGLQCAGTNSAMPSGS